MRVFVYTCEYSGVYHQSALPLSHETGQERERESCTQQSIYTQNGKAVHYSIDDPRLLSSALMQLLWAAYRSLRVVV